MFIYRYLLTKVLITNKKKKETKNVQLHYLVIVRSIYNEIKLFHCLNFLELLNIFIKQYKI